MKKIAIGNFKGGVAKTQTTFELAHFLGTRGKKVLVVDTDPQANITELLLNKAHTLGRTLPQILADGDGVRAEDINHRVIGNGDSIDFIASDINLGRIESRMKATAIPKEFIIQDTISTIPNAYDFILFDMAPSSELMGISSLFSADEVIIPTCLDKLSVAGANKIMQLVQTLQSNDRLNPNLKLNSVIVTRYRRTLSTFLNGKALTESFGNLVCSTYVRESTRIQQASNENMTVQEFDKSHPVAQDYVRVFEEIFPNIK